MTSWRFVSFLPVEEETRSADGDVREEGDDHLVGLRDQGGRDKPSKEREYQNRKCLKKCKRQDKPSKDEEVPCHKFSPSALLPRWLPLATLVPTSEQKMKK